MTNFLTNGERRRIENAKLRGELNDTAPRIERGKALTYMFVKNDGKPRMILSSCEYFTNAHGLKFVLVEDRFGKVKTLPATWFDKKYDFVGVL